MVEGGIQDAEIIFVSVNKPTKTFGVGAGMAKPIFGIVYYFVGIDLRKNYVARDEIRLL